MFSIATLHTATPQQVFDQVVLHILRQGKVSLRTYSDSFGDKQKVCAYRGDGGTKCAAGCLISDEEYSDEMEYKLWTEVVDTFGTGEAHHVYLIERLQWAHDAADGEDFVESFIKKLDPLADAKNLESLETAIPRLKALV